MPLDPDAAQLHDDMRRLMRSVDVVGLSDDILVAAGRPMPTVLGTLDALHLATAMELGREISGLVVATHDVQLARRRRGRSTST